MNTKTNDVRVLNGLVELLIESDLDNEDSFGLKKKDFSSRYGDTTYEHAAEALNEQGLRTQRGTVLSGNSLRQMVHRIKQNKFLFERQSGKINWNCSPVDFIPEITEYQS